MTYQSTGIESRNFLVTGEPYKSVRQSNDSLGQLRLEHGIDNQASFFAFALQLRVPVQSYVANHGCNISLRALGQGASYNVTQTVIGLETDVSSGIGAFVNEESIRKPSHMGIKNENGYVVKSIHTGEPTSDRERLAAISNEIRILSTKTIAERNVCVGLFCVAWDEHPDATGRYWPRVMLPRADHGNLNDYLCSISIQTFEFYLSILSDIAKALEVLHSHGIVHGDVKMENVLVFAQNNMEIKGRVTAKLGDFGFSIIPSDRQETSKFCCTEWGTRPWQAPELTLGEQVLPELLFRVDIYSFGLFCSCVLTHRLRPPDEEIEEHKKYSDPAMAKFVEDFILSHSEFSVVQKRQIRILLDTTLRRHGTDRIGASALAAHIRYMQESSEFPEGETLQSIMHSNPGSTHFNQTVPSVPFYLQAQPDLAHESLADEFCSYLPNFETQTQFRAWRLPPGLQAELLRDFRQIVNDIRYPNHVRGAAAYQLAVCSFQGYGGAPNNDQCFSWLSQAQHLSFGPAQISQRRLKDCVNPRSQVAPLSTVDFDAWLDNTEFGFQEIYSSPRYSGSIEGYQHLRSSPYATYVTTEAYKDRKQQHMLQYIISWHRKSETGLGSFEYGGCSGDFAFFIDTPRSLEGDTFEAKNTALHDPENLTVTDGLIGATLLQHAAIQAHHDLTRLIVSKEGVNLNDCGQIHGLTPLLISCMQGDMYLVRYFLDGGASVQGRDALCGRTVLHFLSQFTDYALMKQVCEEAIRCCIDINSTDNDGRNPLHATFIGLDRSEGEAAKLLLEMGCNPVASDSLGFGPLELAARNFDLHLVKRILKFAPAFERSVPGQVTKVTKIKGKILSTILRNPPFYRMVILGRDRLLPRTKELLDIVRSQDTLDFMSQYDQQRLSLLALAINAGSTDIAEHLIPESQLDVSDNDGRTALHWAIESRSLHVARLLLQHHADPLVPDKKKTTPMHLAARYAPSFQEELAAHIYQLRSLKSPADCLSAIDAKDDIGWTPFLTALLEGTKEHIDCAERLRQKYGIPYDEQAFRSDLFKLPPDCHLSPVGLFTSMASSMKEALLALTHLLSLDPLPNFVCSNRNGLTLFHVVMATSVLGPWGLDVTKLLLRKYPTQQDKGSGNDDGQTPLHWAAAFVNFDAAERFIQDAVNNRQTLDYNPVAGTETPLDYLGRNKQFHKIRYWQKEAQQYEDIVHRDILKLFDMFRCRGAATSLERTGLPLLLTIIPLNRHRSFAAIAASFEQFAISHSIQFSHREEPLRDNVKKHTARFSACVVQISWKIDDFAVDCVECWSNDKQLWGAFPRSYSEQRKNTRNAVREYLSCEEPWTRLQYHTHVPSTTVKQQWTRKGKIWSKGEVKMLILDLQQKMHGSNLEDSVIILFGNFLSESS